MTTESFSTCLQKAAIEKGWAPCTVAQSSGPHVHQNHLGGLSKHRPLGPTSRVSDTVGPGQHPIIPISNTFPDADDVRTSFWEPLALKQKPAGQESKEEGMSWVRDESEEIEWLSILTANFSNTLFRVSAVQSASLVFVLLILSTNCMCYYYFQFAAEKTKNITTLGNFPGRIPTNLNLYPANLRVQPLANIAVLQFGEVFWCDVLGSTCSFKVSNKWGSKTKVIIRVNYSGRIVQCFKSERIAMVFTAIQARSKWQEQSFESCLFAEWVTCQMLPPRFSFRLDSFLFAYLIFKNTGFGIRRLSSWTCCLQFVHLFKNITEIH